MHDAQIKSAWQRVDVVDNNMLAASANLLRFIVDNFDQEEQQSEVCDEPYISRIVPYYKESSRHERKLSAALRDIDDNLYGELSLETVAEHVCLSANYFSRFFKKRQGVNFKTWVSQKKCRKRESCCTIPFIP